MTNANLIQLESRNTPWGEEREGSSYIGDRFDHLSKRARGGSRGPTPPV